MYKMDYDKKLNNYLKPFKVMYDGDGNIKISENFFAVLQSK